MYKHENNYHFSVEINGVGLKQKRNQVSQYLKGLIDIFLRKFWHQFS